MSASQHLKNLKILWASTNHAMWVQILALRQTNAYVVGQFDRLTDANMTDYVHAPECATRLQGFSKRKYAAELESVIEDAVTTRLVLLSAAFEMYFADFLEAWLQRRSKYFDEATGERTPAGNKLSGEVLKVRGMVPRVEKFAELTGARIVRLKTYFDDLADVYEIRNIIAHRAGIADLWAAGNVKGMVVTADKPVVLTPQRLIDYAASVIKIAEGLDSKLEGVPEAAAPKIRRKR